MRLRLATRDRTDACGGTVRTGSNSSDATCADRGAQQSLPAVTLPTTCRERSMTNTVAEAGRPSWQKCLIASPTVRSEKSVGTSGSANAAAESGGWLRANSMVALTSGGRPDSISSLPSAANCRTKDAAVRAGNPTNTRRRNSRGSSSKQSIAVLGSMRASTPAAWSDDVFKSALATTAGSWRSKIRAESSGCRSIWTAASMLTAPLTAPALRPRRPPRSTSSRECGCGRRSSRGRSWSS